MDARDYIKVGLSAERLVTVTHDLTVQRFVPTMPAVYATPMMILEMEMTSGDAIAPYLPAGWVTVGTEVDVRHLEATPVGREVRTTSRVIEVLRRVIRFEVEAFDGDRKIGAGRHGRGFVNIADFETRFGVI
ncbi:MAG TPA: thioesterase [Xanthobacteraceae bacterium]|nr:thioesterase [Xanthobacteraceae bacterium]